MYRRPRILLLVDRPGWAFDTNAQALGRYLRNDYEFQIAYVIKQPDLDAWTFDIIHVFFWGETYHQRFVRDRRHVIKGVASHRWALEEKYGFLTPAEMADRHLADAGTVTCISKNLQNILAPYRDVLLVPDGFEPEWFKNRDERRGSLKIGWAGNAHDRCKGLKDLLLPAAGNDFDLRIAGGNIPHEEMINFYNSIDVLCVASTAEGGPLTLIEGMAAGCFPVAVDVGVVSELIIHRRNGLIVSRTVEAFRSAFQWCAMNIECVRKAGRENADYIPRVRSWNETAIFWSSAFRNALNRIGWSPDS
jgi:hypothetical protein